MKEERILHLLGEVDEKYIAEAAPKETQKKKPVLRRLMIVAACLGLLLTLGCAAVAVSPEVRAAVQSIIEILFPPKEVTVTPEGLPESVPHTAQGQEPTEDAPGFAIYVDEGGYEMTEENGVFVIRPKKSSLSREDVRQNNFALLGYARGYCTIHGCGPAQEYHPDPDRGADDVEPSEEPQGCPQ